jgi:SHS2 domain-containing protein
MCYNAAMKDWKILDHTADLRISVKGSNLKDLFGAALEAMAGIEKRGTRLKRRTDVKGAYITHDIEVNAENATLLLIDFLNQVLSLSQVEHAVFYDVEFEELSKTSLIAHVSGTKVDGFDEDIKAVTYHEADVKRNEKGDYETKIVFDI